MDTTVVYALPDTRRWRQHPVSYLFSGTFCLAVIVASLWAAINLQGAVLQNFDWDKDRVAFLIFTGGIWFITLLFAGPSTEHMAGKLYTVWWLEDDQLVGRYRFIATNEVPLDYAQVAQSEIFQGPIGRMFGYGKITVKQYGRDDRYVIPNAPHARELHDFLQDVAAANQRRRAHQVR